MEKVHPDALKKMKENYPNARWAVYQNAAFDSANFGHLQFLATGEDHTFKLPPNRYPMDNEHGMGWRYVFRGWVNLENGEIKEEKAG